MFWTVFLRHDHPVQLNRASRFGVKLREGMGHPGLHSRQEARAVNKLSRMQRNILRKKGEQVRMV